MRRFATIVVFFATSLLCFPSHRRSHSQSHTGEPGKFDFYLLVLSWSPEFCHSKPSAVECSKHAGFLVHGLWPQRSDGTYPSACKTTQPGPSNPSSMSDIMPPEIIQHEWQQHGTCSGLSGDDYFALIRRAYGSVTIPQTFQSPKSSFSSSPQKLKADFAQVNSGLENNEIAIQLRGSYLNAVEVCLTKDSKPIPTNCTNVRDAKRGTFVVPPVK
jgi:ribonuclease T2